MKSVLGLLFLLSLAISLLLPSSAWSTGLEVDPGEFNIIDVSLGREVAVSELGTDKMKLSIRNKSGSDYTYTIDIFPTLKTVTNLKQGYTDIPDTSWIWPEKKEVLVPGNSVEEVELYLNIPDKEEYYNQKYQAVIEVKNKKNRPEEIFVLACQLRMCFSTCTSDEGERSE